MLIAGVLTQRAIGMLTVLAIGVILVTASRQCRPPSD
jgi:hypothetical protein